MVQRVIIMSKKPRIPFNFSYLNLLFVTLLFAVSQATWAQRQPDTFTVCPPPVDAGDPTCDYNSPQEALPVPSILIDGDVLDVFTGTYVLTGTLQVDKDITILGNGSVFDANGIRAISVWGGGNLTISDITIRNGQPTAGFGGGAISVWGGSTLTVTGGIFENNQAEFGGAIHNSGSSVKIYHSVFTGNEATLGEGGAILTNNGGETLLKWVEIDGNTAMVAGGGLSVRGDGDIVGVNSSRLDIIASTISNNAALINVPDQYSDTATGTSSDCGNGPVETQGQTFVPTDDILTAFEFEVRAGGTPPPAGTQLSGRVRSGGHNGPIIGNATAIWPAGLPQFASLFLRYELDTEIAVTPGAPYAIEIDTTGGSAFSIYTFLDESYVQGSYIDGMAYACGSDPNPLMDYDFRTFGDIDSSADGIYVSAAGSANLLTSTVSGNLGDGVFVALNSETRSWFSTIVNNQGNGLTIRPDVLVESYASIFAINSIDDCRGNLGTNGYNLIGDSTFCTLVPDNAGDFEGNRFAALDPLIGPLQDNDGFTPTHAIDQISPAINNAGVDCLVGLVDLGLANEWGSLDQRETVRPAGAACDIGAFELTRPLQELIDSTGAGGVVSVPGRTYRERITIGDGKTLSPLDLNPVVIDASNLGYSDSVITATGDFTLEGITVTGGHSPNTGGGINTTIDDVDIVLRDALLDNNQATTSGGALYIQHGSLDLTNVIFSNNNPEQCSVQRQ
jgi:predicted outer membrane repeat protein